MVLTKKQEQFTLFIFGGMTQREAYTKAGYSTNTSIENIDSHASVIAKNSKVLSRLAELREKAESDKVMSVIERKERLSEIGRGRITDYQESGMDGGWINIGPESKNTAALSEITSTTKYDENGANSTLITKVKLHNPVNAIAELNKMEKIYTEGPSVNVSQNIQNIGVEVVNFDTKEVTRAIIEAIRLGLNPTILGGNGHSEETSLLPSQTDLQTTVIPESEN